MRKILEINPPLNSICPYFTMFPLSFPLGILSRHGKNNDVVLDPFAGRGTTLYAARMMGLSAFGIDSNPVAAAISNSKLANTTPERVIRAAKQILSTKVRPKDVPVGDFWTLAYEKTTLIQLCKLREVLIGNCESDSRRGLMGILLGALHGPRNKIELSYFSNQCPRTFAPKPKYAAKYWQERGLMPPEVDVLSIIERRAQEVFGEERTIANGRTARGDSRRLNTFQFVDPPNWIITSPPYYGMKTYVPDQWLRNWFVGGTATVDYSIDGQLRHTSQERFANDLRAVWMNCASIAKTGCRLVIRFGAINDRRIDHKQLIRRSLEGTGWRITYIKRAGNASSGKRQSSQFGDSSASAIEELDVWAKLG